MSSLQKQWNNNYNNNKNYVPVLRYYIILQHKIKDLLSEKIPKGMYESFSYTAQEDMLVICLM